MSIFKQIIFQIYTITEVLIFYFYFYHIYPFQRINWGMV